MRRLVDVVVAGVVLLVSSPVAAVVAALVRLRLGRPVLFRQQRVGLRGREFTILKFRTMRPEAYAGEPDDVRDTSLGRALRASQPRRAAAALERRAR